jgi:pyruvate formate lyase activating enzyme
MSFLSNLRGFLPTSMLDWPGKICTVVFLGGCNFRCPYCHNPELVKTGGDADIIPWEDVQGYLEQRIGWIDGVSITGGEPTLQPDLHLLCQRIIDLGMMVKLDTNGSRPAKLQELLARGYLDFVAMDIKTSPAKYHKVAGRRIEVGLIEETIDTILDSGIEHEFRCTVVPGLVNLADMEWMARRVAGSRGLVLQQFNPGTTLDPAYSDKKGYEEETLQEWADSLSRWVKTSVRGLVGVS